MMEQGTNRQRTAELPIPIKTTGLSAEAQEMFDMIARRAYEIFESKGRTAGRDMEHWLAAEAELFDRTPINCKESHDGLTVRADVRGFTPKEIEVDLEPKRVTIIGRHQSQSNRGSTMAHTSESRSTRLLRSMQLPVEVDTRHATARIERGVLELDMKKAHPANGNAAPEVAGRRSA